MNVQIIIPIYNPDDKFLRLLEALNKQTFKAYALLVIDSGETAKYENYLAEWPNAEIKKIPKHMRNNNGSP